MAKEQRFNFSNKTGVLDGVKIITDSVTGVQYIFAFSGNAGGLSVLVDRDGKPLLDGQYVNLKKQEYYER